MRKKKQIRVLITGASGFIGKEVVSLLQENPEYKIQLFIHTHPISSSTRNVEIFQGDLLNKQSLLAALNSIDVVIHIAAAIQHSSQGHIYLTNVMGTKNLVDACSKQTKKPHIIHISTENVLYPQQSAYGDSKRKAEQYIQQYYPGTILRLSTVYGKDDKINLGKIIIFVKKHHYLPIPGNGKSLFQPIHVHDVAVFILHALRDYKRLHGKIFVLAGISQISLNDFVKLISLRLGKKVIFIHLPYSFCLFITKILEIIYPAFPIKSSQIRNLNTTRVYDIKETIKYLKHTPLSAQQGIQQLIRDINNGQKA